ncbi:hypothetical protein L1987_19634 [Smallanthus sonchifolius]|uniref:Uncharacterized protein n=1 Tax=Smallanthus sonchifolius TaxID=185202 RepID=A0ACB9IQV3_9ASTR|nr:hypothetical protein L1987_19634 [Smallanthus sonchifolius]
MKASGIRVGLCTCDLLPKLIRNAEKQKIPLMVVMGPNEVEVLQLGLGFAGNWEGWGLKILSGGSRMLLTTELLFDTRYTQKSENS